MKKEDLQKYHGKDTWFQLQPVSADSEVQVGDPSFFLPLIPSHCPKPKPNTLSYSHQQSNVLPTRRMRSSIIIIIAYNECYTGCTGSRSVFRDRRRQKRLILPRLFFQNCAMQLAEKYSNRQNRTKLFRTLSHGDDRR